MSEAENVELVKQLYAAFGAGDIPAVLNTMADDIRWNYPSVRDVPFAGPRRGTEAVRRFFDELVDADELEAFEVSNEFIAQSDRVVALGSDRGRVRATGRVWEMKFVHVWTVQDSKLQQVDIFYDTAAIGDAHRSDAG